MNIIRNLLNRYVYQDWNIAIADIADDLSPVNIKWMKHSYHDRWFADPFIVDETDENYIILVEECILDTQKGRLARLTVTKDDCKLVKNETILDLPTHLSFPNIIQVNGQTYMYPENGKARNTKLYKYGKTVELCGKLSSLPLADATIFKYEDSFYMLFTIGENCNGNILQIYRSNQPLSGYISHQEIKFDDNIARRAGNIFTWKGHLISPAQVCSHNYGEGVSFQEISFTGDKIQLNEIKRLYPPTKMYSEGFHTFNVFGDKVVIDGYRYGSKFLHDLYFKIRG